MPNVKILQPFKRNNQQKAFPKTFVAHGFAKGRRVATVRATLTDVTRGGNVNVATVYLVHFAPAGTFRGQAAKNRYRWQFLCVNVTAQVNLRDFELKVDAIAHDDSTI